MTDIVPDSVFADGGVAGANPSERGGSWSYVWIKDNVEIRRASGFVLPSDVGLDKITNNLTELLALIHAIEPLPAKWDGHLWTDSLVSLRRVRSPRTAKMNGIPDALHARLVAATDRLGRFRLSLLAGHPTAEDLQRGTKKGTPVSHWNVLCDHLCGEEAKKYAAGGSPRRVDQTLFGPVEGNCLQAAIATVLRVPLADVPHFCRDYKGNEWLAPLQQWAAAHHKLAPIVLEYNDAVESLMSLGGFSIVGGKCPRYNPADGTLHAVVYKGEDLYHDPHPDRTGLVEITDVMVFIPIDPARRR